MFQHLISNTLAKIRNASCASKETVRVALSNTNVSIAKILKAEGYISGFSTQRTNNRLSILLRFNDLPEGQLRIRTINQLSKSGSRSYKGHKELQQINRAMGVTIVSTTKGLMSGRSAVLLGIGGEVICSVT